MPSVPMMTASHVSSGNVPTDLYLRGAPEWLQHLDHALSPDDDSITRQLGLTTGNNGGCSSFTIHHTGTYSNIHPFLVQMTYSCNFAGFFSLHSQLGNLNCVDT